MRVTKATPDIFLPRSVKVTVETPDELEALQWAYSFLSIDALEEVSCARTDQCAIIVALLDGIYQVVGD